MRSHYAASDTALLLVDPYNDFLSEGGKLWPPVKESAEEQNLLPNMKAVMVAVRAAGIGVFYVPHHRAEAGDLDKWQCATPYQQGAHHINGPTYASAILSTAALIEALQ